jgi:Ca-activated chloride channel family protein
LFKSRSARSTVLEVAVLLCCSGSLFISQVPPAALAQIGPAPTNLTQNPVQPPAVTNSPTRPEVQLPLDVDRDPIPSPDSSANVSATPASSPNAPKAPAEIQKQQNGVYILQTHVDEVLLNCAVIDEKGRVVLDLNPRDFSIWEDGVPQKINSVQHLDLPVSMGILVDNSGSMRDKRAVVNAATIGLLRASNTQDEAFIVNFSDRPYLDQRFTTDRVALDRGISRFDSAGTTALYDAVAASADELAKHGKNRKQVLLIITDGADNASRLSLEEAIRRVQGMGGPVVYTVGLLFDTGREESERVRSDLEELSRETGGVAYFPHSLEDVNTIAAEVANDIRQQYVVDYHSSKPFSLGGYRSVRVEASTPHHGRLFVRTRRGYYAQTEQPQQPRQETKQ